VAIVCLPQWNLLAAMGVAARGVENSRGAGRKTLGQINPPADMQFKIWRQTIRWVPSCSTATFNFRFFFDFHSGPTKVSASRAELKRQLNRNEKKKRRNGTGAVAVAVRSKEGGGGVEQVSAGVCVACGQSESGAATENRKKVRARTGTQCCGKVCAPQTLYFQTFKFNP